MGATGFHSFKTSALTSVNPVSSSTNYFQFQAEVLRKRSLPEMKENAIKNIISTPIQKISINNFQVKIKKPVL